MKKDDQPTVSRRGVRENTGERIRKNAGEKLVKKISTFIVISMLVVSLVTFVLCIFLAYYTVDSDPEPHKWARATTLISWFAVAVQAFGIMFLSIPKTCKTCFRWMFVIILTFPLTVMTMVCCGVIAYFLEQSGDLSLFTLALVAVASSGITSFILAGWLILALFAGLKTTYEEA